MGLHPDPCASYSLSDRFVCGKCGISPTIKKVEGEGPIMVTVECHGETHTGVYERRGSRDGASPKNSLVFTQYVFDEERK